MKLPHLWFIALLLGLSLWACGPAPKQQAHREEVTASDRSPSRPAAPPSRTMPNATGLGGLRGEMEEDGRGVDDREGLEQASESPDQPRMVYYNGYAKLRVTKVEETINLAIQIATQLDGFVEHRTNTQVTLRVPVAKFEEGFDGILALGDVLDRSVTAEDVTEAYQSVELRLKTASATRERLIELLAKAETEAEKLSLLREIRRLTEEIDRLEVQIKTLASLASYSRITLVAVPRETLDTRVVNHEISEFRWIHSLTPFNRNVSRSGMLLKMDTPEGLVVLSEKPHWVAESADGVVFWTSKRKNLPEGDTDFWMQAIKGRLESEFAKAEVVEMGRFKVLRLVDRSDNPYRYLVGVHAHGDKLNLVEVHYPSAAHEKRYGKAIEQAIERGEQ